MVTASLPPTKPSRHSISRHGDQRGPSSRTMAHSFPLDECPHQAQKPNVHHALPTQPPLSLQTAFTKYELLGSINMGGKHSARRSIWTLHPLGASSQGNTQHTTEDGDKDDTRGKMTTATRRNHDRARMKYPPAAVQRVYVISIGADHTHESWHVY